MEVWAYLEITVAVAQEYYYAIFMESLHLQFLFRFFSLSLFFSPPLHPINPYLSHETRNGVILKLYNPDAG
jgi:hypothetical protein